MPLVCGKDQDILRYRLKEAKCWSDKVEANLLMDDDLRIIVEQGVWSIRFLSLPKASCSKHTLFARLDLHRPCPMCLIPLPMLRSMDCDWMWCFAMSQWTPLTGSWVVLSWVRRANCTIVAIMIWRYSHQSSKWISSIQHLHRLWNFTCYPLWQQISFQKLFGGEASSFGNAGGNVARHERVWKMEISKPNECLNA